MAHLTDGTLRRMVDDPDARAGDAAHLEGCSECKGRFENISDDARSIATLLGRFETTGAVIPASASASDALVAACSCGCLVQVMSP